MYLALRCHDIDEENPKDGKTIFTINLLRRNAMVCKQLLMRGADINHRSKLGGGKTPIHFAVESKLPEKLIQFLL